MFRLRIPKVLKLHLHNMNEHMCDACLYRHLCMICSIGVCHQYRLYTCPFSEEGKWFRFKECLDATPNIHCTATPIIIIIKV